MVKIYKICPEIEWRRACDAGHYAGSAADLADGFIHLSAAGQVAGTAAKHFAGQTDLLIIEFDADRLANLKWEASCGGALFPHVYGTLPTAAALRAADLPLREGQHELPWGLPE